MTHEEVIAKVRKLYALAQGNASEGEAQAAIGAAERLIQAHRLSAAEVNASGSGGSMADGRIPHVRALWARFLLSTLCRHYQCAPVDLGASGFRVFGRSEDLALLTLQYDRIREQVERLCVMNCTGKGRSYADSYKKGVVASITERLKRSNVEAQQATSTAIVRVMDQRKAEADSALHAAYPSMKIVKRNAGRVSREAYEHGKRDGVHVHMGESLGSGVRGMLGSG